MVKDYTVDKQAKDHNSNCIFSIYKEIKNKQ